MEESLRSGKQPQPVGSFVQFLSECVLALCVLVFTTGGWELCQVVLRPLPSQIFCIGVVSSQKHSLGTEAEAGGETDVLNLLLFAFVCLLVCLSTMAS